jgi:hypothetical protein
MSTVDWGTSPAFCVLSADFWLENTDVISRSALGGGMQTSGVPGAHWKAALVFPKSKAADRHELIGYLRKLNGREHRIALWDLRKFSAAGVQGEPMGTINTVGITVSANAAQFATAVTLAGCGNAKTLLAGDMLSINGQLIEVCETSTASVGGVMSVLVPQRMRLAAAAGTAVTLIKPTAKFVLAGDVHSMRDHAMYDQFAIDLEEVFA